MDSKPSRRRERGTRNTLGHKPQEFGRNVVVDSSCSSCAVFQEMKRISLGRRHWLFRVCRWSRKGTLSCKSILATYILLGVGTVIQAQRPTNYPTMWPSLSMQPMVSSQWPSISKQPSGEPTVSSAPTTSRMPSKQPTLFPQPSKQPTITTTHPPSMTQQPSYHNSIPSTAEPTWLPSVKASISPSQRVSTALSHSSRPSIVPSSELSLLPSDAPMSLIARPGAIEQGPSYSNSTPTTGPTVYQTVQPSAYHYLSSPQSRVPTTAPSLTPGTNWTVRFATDVPHSATPTSWGENLLSAPSRIPTMQPRSPQPLPVPSTKPSWVPSSTSWPSLRLPSGPPQSITPTSWGTAPPTISSRLVDVPTHEPSIRLTGTAVSVNPSFQPTRAQASTILTNPPVAKSIAPTSTPSANPTRTPTTPRWTPGPSLPNPSVDRTNNPTVTGIPATVPRTSVPPSPNPLVALTNNPSVDTTTIPTSGSQFPRQVVLTNSPSVDTTTTPPSGRWTKGPWTNPSVAMTDIPSSTPPTITPTIIRWTSGPSPNPSVPVTNAPSVHQPGFPTSTARTRAPSAGASTLYPALTPSTLPTDRPSLYARLDPTSSQSAQPTSVLALVPDSPQPTGLQLLVTTTPASKPTLAQSSPPSAAPSISIQPSMSMAPSTVPTPVHEFPKVTLQADGIQFVGRLGLLGTQRRELQVSVDGCQTWIDYVAGRIRNEVILVLPVVETVRVRIMNATYEEQVTLRTIVFAFDVHIELWSPLQEHDVRRYIEGAFDSASELDDFVSFLRSSHCPDFADITTIALVLPAALIAQPPPRKGPHLGLLQGIAVGVAAFGMFLAAFLLMKLHHRSSQVAAGVIDEEPPADSLESFYEPGEYVCEIGVRDTFDVSTLSDPIVVRALPVSAAGPETSTMESLSVDYDYRRAYRDERSVSDVEGSVPESRSNIIIFTDDNTLAAQYESLDHFDVAAPPGALGLVLRFGDNGIPTISAINAGSPLADRVEVGDLLLSVDGEDVTAMLPTVVAKLMAKKKDQSVRRLIFSRPCLNLLSVDDDSFEIIDDIPPTS